MGKVNPRSGEPAFMLAALTANRERDVRFPRSDRKKTPPFGGQSMPGTTRNKSVSAVFSPQAVISACTWPR